MKEFLSRFSFDHGLIKGITLSIGLAKDNDELVFILIFICYGFSINYRLN